MARVIDADLYLKDLEKIRDELQGIVDNTDCDKERELAMFQISLLSVCVLKLTEQPTIELKHEWNNVKNGLPKQLKEVLIYFSDYGRKRVSTATYRNYFYGEEWVSNMMSLSMDSVTHWMPLPKPPEEEEHQ